MPTCFFLYLDRMDSQKEGENAGIFKPTSYIFIKDTLTSPHLFIIHANPCNVDGKPQCKGGIKIQSSPLNPLHPPFTLESTAKKAVPSLFNLTLMSVMTAIQTS